MLSSPAAGWPAGEGWVMQPKWDGFRLLVSVDRAARVRAWSRHGTSLTAGLGDLLQGFTRVPVASVFDAELVSLAQRDGQVVQDFNAVCRAALRGDGAAAAQLRLVVFDVLELDGQDLRPRPWIERDSHLRSALPISDRVCVIQSQPATIEGHGAIVGLGFEGTVLKRSGSAYRPGRQSAWQKVKARHRATVTLRSLAAGWDGKIYAVCDLQGRRIVALSGQHLASRVGGEVELVYSRVDADGSLREARTSSAPAAHRAGVSPVG
jgi:bifunctional non-homologous end joining protein LigD